VRNKVEGVNRSRGEAGETIHHLYMALLKKYISAETYAAFRARYKECIRMLNGLEKTLERKLPPADRRWQVAEEMPAYGQPCELDAPGWPEVET
jgi:hypothetical protein